MHIAGLHTALDILCFAVLFSIRLMKHEMWKGPCSALEFELHKHIDYTYSKTFNGVYKHVIGGLG